MQTAALCRDRGVDLAKTAAIACVLVIHCCWYNDPVGSFQWGSAVFWGSLTRPAVPLFLMCSGALLLSPERELTARRLFSRSIPRLLLAMWFWGMVYKLPGSGFHPGALWQAWKEVLCFQQEFHFYYIHMCLILYLSLPPLRTLCALEDRRPLAWVLGLWFGFGIVYPTLRAFWPFTLLGGMAPQFQINMTWACLGYALLGWRLRERPLPLWAGLLLFLAGFAMNFGGTWLLSLRQGELNGILQEGMGFPVCLMSAGAFALLCRAGERIPEGSAGIAVTEFVSKGSFCVYLVHVSFLYLFRHFGLTQELLPRPISIPLLAALILACSLGCYCILRKIPLVNRWLI